MFSIAFLYVYGFLVLVMFSFGAISQLIGRVLHQTRDWLQRSSQ